MLHSLGCKPIDFDHFFARDIISFANNSGCCHISSFSNVQMYGIMLLGYMIPLRHLIESGLETDLLISMLFSILMPILNRFVISIKSLSSSNNLVELVRSLIILSLESFPILSKVCFANCSLFKMVDHFYHSV